MLSFYVPLYLFDSFFSIKRERKYLQIHSKNPFYSGIYLVLTDKGEIDFQLFSLIDEKNDFFLIRYALKR